MRQTLFIVFLLLFSILSASDITKNPPESQAVYEKVKPAVFQIKTAKDEKASKASYGSGFVVDADGLVITNYHVVATVLQDEDKRYNIYLVDGDKSWPAQIVKFSVIYDIALLKVDKKFDTVLKLEKKTPEHGENIYSIGKPKELNMTIVDGKYNGIIKKAIYERIQMSTPLNGGMSGGPTVNARGDVIGVNVSVLLRSDNISFAVPIEKAFDILHDYKETKIAVKEKDVDIIVKDQLSTIEKSLMYELTENSQSETTLGIWQYKSSPQPLKCWTTSRKDDKKQIEINRQSCYLKSAAYIKHGHYSGSYELRYVAMKNIKLNTVQFYSQVESDFNMGSMMENMYLTYFPEKELSGYSCDEIIIVNKNNISFKVKYCVNEFLRYQGLYQAKIDALSFGDAQNAIIFSAHLDGFNAENIKKFIELHLSSIRKNNE